jgi:hypothetical protein
MNDKTTALSTDDTAGATGSNGRDKKMIAFQGTFVYHSNYAALHLYSLSSDGVGTLEMVVQNISISPEKVRIGWIVSDIDNRQK